MWGASVVMFKAVVWGAIKDPSHGPSSAGSHAVAGQRQGGEPKGLVQVAKQNMVDWGIRL